MKANKTEYKELLNLVVAKEEEVKCINESIEASYHSLIRARERLGLKTNAAEREIRKAYTEGLDATEFNSREKEYLINKGLSGAIVKVFNGSCYIFSENAICITIYKVPSWFGRRQYFDGKEKIRNPKNYYRHYGVMA